MQENELILDSDGITISVDAGKNGKVFSKYGEKGTLQTIAHGQCLIESKNNITIKVSESQIEIDGSTIKVIRDNCTIKLSSSGVIISVGTQTSLELSTSSISMSAPTISISATGTLSLKGAMVSIN
jgi:hypothetical protein